MPKPEERDQFNPEVAKQSGLEHILGSQSRELVLRFLLLNDHPCFLREMARNLDQHLNAVRREIDRFASMGLVNIEPGPERKKFFVINKRHVLYPELKALIVKSHLLFRSHLMTRLKKVGRPVLVVVTGFFTGADCPTDILFVGSIPRKAFDILLADYEKELGREINYTILTVEEFNYRQAVDDRFLQQIFNQPHLELVNKINQSNP